MKRFIKLAVNIIFMLCLLLSCSMSIEKKEDSLSPTVKGRIALPADADITADDIVFTLNGIDQKYRVNPDGTWEVSGLEDGQSYTLYFSSYKSAKSLSDVSEWGAKLVDVVARSGKDLFEYFASITRTWELKGKVELVGIDPSIGLGLAGTSVFIPGTGYTAMTDRNGFYSLKGVPEGSDYSLIYMHDGFVGMESNIFELKTIAGQSRVKTIDSAVLVKDRGYVCGRVVLNECLEHSYINDTVYASRNGKNTPIYPVLSDGSYNIEGLQNGTYTLHFKIVMENGDTRMYDREITIFDGSSIRYDLVVGAETYSIQGVVTDSLGMPVEGATVSIGKLNTQSGSDGSFRLSGISEGKKHNLFINKANIGTYSTVIAINANLNLGSIKLRVGESSSEFRTKFIESGLEIIKYNGTAENLVIPDVINGQKVVAIGRQAFAGNKKLVSVTIPDSVTVINDAAFYQCSSLKTIKLGSGVSIIGGWCFHDCTALESIEFNTTLNRIEQQVFRNCRSLKSITIPDSVTYLGDAVFWDCKGLTEAHISNKVKAIPGWLFDRCEKLVNITIAPDIESIGKNAFRSTAISGTFEIPSTVTFVDSWAFERTKINKIIIHNTEQFVLNNWSQYWNNTGAEISYNGSDGNSPDNLSDWKYKKVSGEIHITGYSGSKKYIAIPDTIAGSNVTTIEANAFQGNRDIVSVVVSDNVTDIKNAAFYQCSSLKTIKLGSNVATIGGWCFHDCTALESIEWNTSIERIEEQAFRNCISLKSIDMPDSVTYLGKAVFWDCKGLTDVHLSSNVKEIPGWLFDRCSKLANITIAPDITSIGLNAFRDCPITGVFNIPATVGYVGSWAFEGTSLDKIVIHNSSDFVKNNWASDWNNTGSEIIYEPPEILSEWLYKEEGGKLYITGYTGTDSDLIVPSEIGGRPITGIYSESLSNNPYIVNVTFSEGIETIWWGVLENCPNLLSMHFPASLEYCDCPGRLSPNVTTITVSPDNPIFKSDGNCFIDTRTNTLLFGANNPVIPSYVETIDAYSFQKRLVMTDISIPEGVVRIGNYAFNECNNLKNVQLPETLKRIGKQVFFCTQFKPDLPDEFYWTWDTSDGVNAKLVEYSGFETNVEVPDMHDGLPVTELEWRCFNNNDAEKVILPSSLRIIENEAFVYCPKLKEITLPSGLEYIRERAFASSCNIKSIRIPSSVVLGPRVFEGWTSEQEILIEDTKTTVNEKWDVNWKEGCGASVIYDCNRP